MNNEIVVDLSRSNLCSQSQLNSPKERSGPKSIFDHLKDEIESRALNKRYLEERDFSNKSPFTQFFTGDHFKQLHDARSI